MCVCVCVYLNLRDRDKKSQYMPVFTILKEIYVLVKVLEEKLSSCHCLIKYLKEEMLPNSAPILRNCLHHQCTTAGDESKTLHIQ